MSVDSKPLSVNPTLAWEGNDGPWSTFFLGVGTPLQYLHVLISLVVPLPWIVVPEGCTITDPSSCPSHRGELFQRNASTTWLDQGLFTLGDEENLGVFENGIFGFDTLATGLSGMGAVTIEKQLVAGIATKSFYLGLWGMGSRPINLTTVDNGYPSMMTTLKDKKIIPSVSYGYTAGARYQLKQVFGSLTLGGYDASRFVQHNTTFTLAEDPSRDMVVGLQGITVKGLSTSTSSMSINLLPQPILTFIDAGESHIWLPASACDMFSETFGLEYDSATELYFVNDTVHDALLRSNATLTFAVAGGIASTNKDAVTIEFPYAAFDLKLTADYPGINTTTYYFPIRRAANDTQYTLGRTFLQQAYVIADYERSRFSVHPCVFSESAEADIRTILPPSNNSTATSDGDDGSGHSFMPGVIAAVVIGSVLGVFLIAIVSFVLGRRRSTDQRSWRLKMLERFGIRSRKHRPPVQDYKSPEGEGHAEMEGNAVYRGELDGDSKHPAELVGGFQRPKELGANDSGPASELEEPRVVRVELPENEVRYELDAGGISSYGQTPRSKEGSFQRLLKGNASGTSSSSATK